MSTALVIIDLQKGMFIDEVAPYRGDEVSDAHTTFDSPVLTADRIVENHNRTLNGGFVDLSKSNEVQS